ncbi:flavodoxin family protein [Desulfonatronovibrio magnus]|uniref:flavodoxin family protein n=1 Tax=Desulfonatronovibrio magnus TaxID=698827 RepID=UPI0005EB0B4C|nr:NAD(P)H-dependent oxidoreductase [Desulfonatronovibrio magnus]
MQILVLYFSKSGNTKKLAQAIANGVDSVEGASAVLRNTEEVTKDDFLNASGVIAGSPVYFGLMAAELKKVFDDFISLRKKMEGKVGAAFATSGDPTGGKETTMFSIIQVMMIYGMVIVGDPMSATGHYGTACVKEPDEKAMENGAKLGIRVAETAFKLNS